MSTLVTRWPLSTWMLRAAVLLLPLAALALALPQRPHWALTALVVVSAVRWASSPEDVAGVVTIVAVAGWWAVHDDLGWRLLVVGVLLVTSHVCAVLGSYGPARLPVSADLVRSWLTRWGLVLAPLAVAWLAVGLLPDLRAPGWVWPVAVATTLAGILAVTAAHPGEDT